MLTTLLALRLLRRSPSACCSPFSACCSVPVLRALLALIGAFSAWFALSALRALPYAHICLQSLHACFACSVFLDGSPCRCSPALQICPRSCFAGSACPLCLCLLWALRSLFAALGLYFSLNHPSVMFAWLAMSACLRARTSSIACFACSARSVGLCRIRGLPRKRTECAPHLEEFRVGLLAKRRPKNNEVKGLPFVQKPCHRVPETCSEGFGCPFSDGVRNLLKGADSMRTSTRAPCGSPQSV